jgi:hypothetical protein
MTVAWPPVHGAKTSRDERAHLIAACAVGSDADRQHALRNLCTCHVQADDDEVWATLVRMLDDPVVRVRAEALHAVTDSTPASRVETVVAALEAHRDEDDLKLRRRIRKTLAHYRRTGKLTDAPR